MKKLVALLSVIMLIGAVAAYAADTYTGYVADEKCANAHKGDVKAPSEACTKKCLENGQKVVLVDEKTKEILAIANPEALKGHEAHHVQVTGTMENNALHVDSVKMVAENDKDKSK